VNSEAETLGQLKLMLPGVGVSVFNYWFIRHNESIR
jgi:hypothetical protein